MPKLSMARIRIPGIEDDEESGDTQGKNQGDRTKDILHVMQLLGHKSIKNTLVYTHLVDFGGDEYVCKVAKTVEEARVLVESGFDYVACRQHEVIQEAEVGCI